MSPIPNIKMRGNRKKKSDSNLVSEPCRPNLANLSQVADIRPTCRRHAQLRRESLITMGKKKFYLFCCGGKVLLRLENKKVLSILLWRESFITTGKKSCIYFVMAGGLYYDRKNKKFYLFCCGGKVLLQLEKKKVQSFLLWRESFIMTRKKKVLSILLWQESLIMTGKKKFYLFCCGG